MKKFPYGSAAALLAATAGFGLLWLNNLVSAYRYYADLAAGRGGDSQPSGLLAQLDWSTVDVSTVTTFVPFFGFLLMFAGLFRVRRNAEWPFFPGYDRLNIALGLLGTVWGIILVGYYPADQISIAALMRCLHTAMFSTLIAVGWVMVFLPLAGRPWMAAVRRRALGETEADDSSLEELADTLTDGLRKAGVGLAAAGDSAREFRAEFAGLAADLAAGREAEARWRREAAETMNAFAEAARVWQAQQTALAGENRKLTERRDSLEKQLAEAEAALAGLRRQLDAIREITR